MSRRTSRRTIFPRPPTTKARKAILRSPALEREIAELESKLSAAVSDKEKESGKVRDFNTMYVRLQSDFDNYRKRTAEQLGRAKNDGIAEAIIKMIPCWMS